MSDQVTFPQRTVGPYEIYREIGRGGMAVVYLARQTTLERDIALKELSSFHAQHPHFAERFLHESKLTGSLNHPNIVTVYEYLEGGGVPYIAMEYVSCGSLRPHVGRLSFAQFAGVMEGILAGLSHAESRAIVHRDLKPENILVSAEGRIKIGDFGIAKATQRAAPLAFVTATGTTVGTPAYMAPEQAMAKKLGPWTDLYSLGIMAWEHVVGHVPFHDLDHPMAVLMRHVTDTIPTALEVNPDVDANLSAWIDRLLIKDPEARTRSASIAWEELEEIVAGQLGALWRREARLPTAAARDQPLRPTTPAPFESQRTPTPPPVLEDGPAESGYLTFRRSRERLAPVAPDGGSAADPLADIAITGKRDVLADHRPEPVEPPATDGLEDASALSIPELVSPAGEDVGHAPPDLDRAANWPSGTEALRPGDLAVESELHGLSSEVFLEPPMADRESLQVQADDLSPRRPSGVPPEQGVPPAAPARRWRRLSWFSLPLLAAICAAGVVTLLQHPKSLPTQAPSVIHWQPFKPHSGRYVTEQPAGWSTPCDDQQTQCGNAAIDIPRSVHRTQFVDPSSDMVITIDRHDGSAQPEFLVGGELILANKNYTHMSFRPEGPSSIRPGAYYAAFTTDGVNGDPPAEVIYGFQAGGETYIVSGVAQSLADARKLAVGISSTLQPRR